MHRLNKIKHEELLAEAAAGWSPSGMRNLATSLLQLADSLDQGWEERESPSVFRWPSQRSRIERNAINLAKKAKILYLQRDLRTKYLPQDLLAEPAWDMLLELFMQHAGGAKVSVTSLCIASRVPVSTAMRYLELMEKLGLVERAPSMTDKRVIFVGLSERGVVVMGSYLGEI